jgi:hypothetical protein
MSFDLHSACCDAQLGIFDLWVDLIQPEGIKLVNFRWLLLQRVYLNCYCTLKERYNFVTKFKPYIKYIFATDRTI